MRGPSGSGYQIKTLSDGTVWMTVLHRDDVKEEEEGLMIPLSQQVQLQHQQYPSPQTMHLQSGYGMLKTGDISSGIVSDSDSDSDDSSTATATATGSIVAEALDSGDTVDLMVVYTLRVMVR